MENKKYYPAELKEVVLKSLSFYPELEEVEIHFKFAPEIKSSVMQAQPRLNTIFRPKSKRSYVIRMARKFKMEGEIFDLRKLPFEVLVGWIGHELGHIMDYLNRSVPSLAAFGLGYVLSDHFLKGAERTADQYAVSHGLGDYILATKNFILNHSHFTTRYKDKIRKLYLSPEEILQMMEEHESVEELRG